MTKFKIQLKNPKTGEWEAKHAIDPCYKYGTTRVRRWLLFYRTIGIVTNMVSADLAARRLAIHLAKKMYWNFPCRVERVSYWSGAEAKDVIWQNGKVIYPKNKIM